MTTTQQENASSDGPVRNFGSNEQDDYTPTCMPYTQYTLFKH